MGEAGQAPDLTHGSQILAAFAAFPSPASASDVLSTTPLLERAAPRTLPSSSSSVAAATAAAAISPPVHHHLLSAASDVVPTDPDPVNDASQVLTPPAKDFPEPDLNMLVGGALAPTHSTPPTPISSNRARPAGLRLPSFDMLGIAAPHPDRYGFGPFNNQTPGGGNDITPESLSSPQAGAEVANAFESLKLDIPALDRPADRAVVDKIPGRPLQSPHLWRDPLTPPDDVPYLDWHRTDFTRLAAQSDDGQPPSQDPVIAVVESNTEVGESSGQQEAGTGSSSRRMSLLWFDAALQTISKCLLAHLGVQ